MLPWLLEDVKTRPLPWTLLVVEVFMFPSLSQVPFSSQKGFLLTGARQL